MQRSTRSARAHPSWYGRRRRARGQSVFSQQDLRPLTSFERIKFVIAFIISAVPLVGPLLVGILPCLLPRVSPGAAFCGILSTFVPIMLATTMSTILTHLNVSSEGITFPESSMSHPLVALLTVHVLCVIGLWIYIYFAAFRGLFAEDKDLRHRHDESGEELESLHHHQTAPQPQPHQNVADVEPTAAGDFATRARMPYRAVGSPSQSRHSADSSVANSRPPSIFSRFTQASTATSRN
ncbi:hypothetical protein JCM3765_003564 [Sporobolomyces pararoseus]